MAKDGSLESEKYIKGEVKAVFFYNEQNHYSVLRVQVLETTEAQIEKDVTVTGYFPLFEEEETYTFFGKMTNHPKFGEQFQATHFRKELPTTKEGIIHYLSGDLFKGIGKKTAQSVVEHLGENAISKILQNPSVLDSVPKLNSEKAKALSAALKQHQGLEQVMISLNSYGFGPQLSMKIYQAYQDQTIEKIKDNPYQLVQDIQGIGFAKADELGEQIGIYGNNPERLKAAILYILEQASLQEGHVYLTVGQLQEKAKQLLDQANQGIVLNEDILQSVSRLSDSKDVILDEEKVYMPALYYAEQGVARHLKRISSQTEYEDAFPESEFLLSLGSLEERMNVQYAPSQRDAIRKALMSPIMLLTGGPGTGKTTVIKGIVELYADLHGISLDQKEYKKDNPFPVLLAAPTGRAAKRMSEATGLPAVTIHRLLGWNGAEGFDHNEDQPISGKLLIVDEVSMVDIWLANSLLKALPEHIQLIMVGDEDQLPSVGPGQVLRDMLSSDSLPAARLTDIYRQAEGSSIIEMAHDIKNGKVTENLLSPTPDRSFIRCGTQQISDVVKKVIVNARNKGYTARDIQVLAPMYKGGAGIDMLNKLLQEIFNPPHHKKRELAFGDVVYRNGDKVLQLVNQPESNVFNGDMGEIVSIFYAKENTEKEDMIVISFEGNEVTYTKQDFNQFTHAYCCSIHKSQGSEFPIVVLPVVKSYYRMLRRNLIYTAITRSKQFLILCGEPDAFQRGIQSREGIERQTTLAAKLSGESLNTELQTLQDELPFSIQDANIGMEGVTPFDFM
ncbi:ATP-dependent RecD-like DNA helicase [Bacillus lacus]|uniref:ATP-dependent RecD2 DNA helicase n=1 Tax=Metabacillus lacus TaxID=1983721 RepID=A0A7X2IWZ6_9BACI|nr:ATP-dependent RecD-like DNA helicase [Metabacillus lacus]MRX71371.1 ATP-dependent RecD-like DNA helicase [Metabacillus lacus]